MLKMSPLEIFDLFWFEIVFVGNFLDRICILSSWFLICLKVNDDFFFNNWFCLDQFFFWGTNVYKDVPYFLFFGHMDVLEFLKFYLKLNFYFFIFFYHPFFFKISGLPFHLWVLDNGLIEGLVLLYLFNSCIKIILDLAHERRN